MQYTKDCKSIRKAVNYYSILSKTLEYRIKKGNSESLSHIEPSCFCRMATKERLVKHIKVMHANRLSMGRDDVHKLALNFAEKLAVNHKFNRKTGLDRYPWFARFLRDDPDLSVRVAGVSLSRA